MADMAGFGSFGGGLAQGFMSTYGGLKRIQSDDAEEKRKQESHKLSMESGGLQLKAAKRADQQADIRQQIQDIAMQVQSGAIPEAEGLRRLATVHGPHPDGKQAFITNVNGQPYAVLGDEATRAGTLHPITGDGSTFMKAYTGLLSVLDPNYGQKERELGIRDKQAGAAVTSAGAAAKNADTNERLRGAHERVYGAMANYYNAGARGARLGGQEQITNFVDAQGNAHPYAFNRATRGFEPLQLPAGMHLPTQKAGWQPVQGNPGLFTNGQDFALYDEGSKSFQPVPTPQSLAQIAETIRKSRQQAGQPQGGIQFPYTPSGDRAGGGIGTLVPRAMDAAGGFFRGLPPRDPSLDYAGGL